MSLFPPICLQAFFTPGASSGNDYTTTMSITPQFYMANGNTNSQYNGTNVAVGMYATSNFNGQIFRIKSISSQSSSSVTAVLEDVNGINKVIDTSGGINGGGPVSGTGYIFEVNSNGLPILTAVNNAPTITFPDSILGRFIYDDLETDKTTLNEEYSVMVGSGTSNSFATSTDGLTWVGRGKGPFSIAGYNVVYNGSIWVAVGEGTNTIATSTDGITWTGRGTPVTNRAYGIVWNGSIWVAVGQGVNNSNTGKIATSPDGITWTQITPIVTGTLATCNAIGWNGDYFVLCVGGTTTTTILYTSRDAITWTTRTAPSGIISLRTVSWGNGLWVAGGGIDTNLAISSRTTIITSSDGITWTRRGASSSGPILPVECRDVAYNGSLWVAVGGNATTSLVTSTNGTSWTSRGAVFGTAQNVDTTRGESITWNRSVWIGCGIGDNQVVTSTNGTSWVTQVAGGTNAIFSDRGYGVSSRFGYPYAKIETRLVATERLGSKRMILSNNGNIIGDTATDEAALNIRNGGIQLFGLPNNSTTRPAIDTSTSGIANFVPNYEIRSRSFEGGDGFLRIRAGGTKNGGSNRTSYIDLSGFSTQSDMDRNIVFGTAGTECMRINVNGNVGIGTPQPNKKLTVDGDMEIGINDGSYRHFRIGGGNSSGFLYGAFAKYGDGIHIGYNFYNNNTNNQIINTGGETSRLSLGYGNIRMFVGGVNTEPSTLGLAINSIGNVGIGTTSPDNSLHIQKKTSYTDGASHGISFGTLGYPHTAKIQCVDINSDNTSNQELSFITSRNGEVGTEKLRITGNGNVGIGRSDVSSKFVVSNNSNSNITFDTLSGGNDGFMSIGFNGGVSTSDTEYRFNTNKNRFRLYHDIRSTTDRFQIDTWNGTATTNALAILTNGNVGIGTTSPSQKLDVNGTIRGIGSVVNVVAVTGPGVPSAGANSDTFVAFTSPLTACTINYTPKQSGTVTIVTHAAAEMAFDTGSGFDALSWVVNKVVGGLTFTISYSNIQWNGNTVTGRTFDAPNTFGAGVGITTITGPTTFNLVLRRSSGDDTPYYKNAYLVLEEISNAV